MGSDRAVNGGSQTAAQEARKVPTRLSLGRCQQRLGSRCQVTGARRDARALGSKEGCVSPEGRVRRGSVALRLDSAVKQLQ